MSPDFLIIAAIIFFVAGIFHGSIGTGFPMIATPLLALITDLQIAIILTLIPTVLVNLVSIISEGNALAAVKQHVPLALYALLGSSLGTILLISLNSDIFKALLGIAILIYLYIDKVQFNLSWIRQRPQLSKLIFGTSAGFLGGLTNVMAPVLIIYSLESRHTKKQIIQANNLCFMFGKLIQIILFSSYGLFNQSELTNSLIMILVTSFALFIGIKIKKRIEADLYKKILKRLLLVLAIIILIQVAF
ncbi:sulfite exporter TauE/SafE family protein [uncultured Cocleimonas sp.]|uniref:sulfite exporter TauE/SafE family protein n=1 Tax=uncultured Cocleimonas sp. TaxID=1051587 RepID=UPI0026180824|nr:sulfite exporter TauE/SafE family protein [uncultured Cocleimonas sp.]